LAILRRYLVEKVPISDLCDQVQAAQAPEGEAEAREMIALHWRFSLRSLFLFLTLVGVLLLPAAVFYYRQPHIDAEAEANIKFGMAIEEVRAIAGEPNGTYAPMNGGQVWVYNSQRLGIGGHQFLVHFSKEGKVAAIKMTE